MPHAIDRLRAYAVLVCVLFFGFMFLLTADENPEGRTEILNWPDGKKAAISLTYDDGTENQFKVALPIMEKLGLPATFFIITGEVQGSKYKPAYIGRAFDEIARESESLPTDEKNFLERSSAIKFSGYQNTVDIHTHIGEVFEDGKLQEAYRLIDDAYAKIRKGELKREAAANSAGAMSWNDFRKMTERGYEFASHTISHPYLSVLDDPNLLFELEKSRQEILEQLGKKQTFSIECPYGTENERVVHAAIKIYPLSRNLMPDDEVQDLNRWDDQDPGASPKAYVRWQRGPLTATPIELMKKWVESIIRSDNVWLVLVFHGVNGIGWEPLPSSKLQSYFKYIKSHNKDIWVATFQDAGKYIREKVSARVSAKTSEQSIRIMLTHPVDPRLYDLALSLKTYVPSGWKRVQVEQQGTSKVLQVRSDSDGSYVIYQAIPNAGEVTLRPGL